MWLSARSLTTPLTVNRTQRAMLQRYMQLAYVSARHMLLARIASKLTNIGSSAFSPSGRINDCSFLKPAFILGHRDVTLTLTAWPENVLQESQPRKTPRKHASVLIFLHCPVVWEARFDVAAEL